jgi:hypothetical protein
VFAFGFVLALWALTYGCRLMTGRAGESCVGFDVGRWGAVLEGWA